MEDLPDHLVVEIFDRLDSGSDLANCRLVSKRLHSSSYNVHSISICCSNHRVLLQTRDPTAVVPFKSILRNLVSLFDRRYLQCLSVEFEHPFSFVDDGDDNMFDDRDDFWMTDQVYVASLLGGPMGSRLISLVLSDFWPQSCWRRSTVLGVVSTTCKKLRNLEIRNAWLCVKDLKPMLILQSLEFNFIRLDDEDLDMINKCFPFLEVLKLIDVGGLTNPKIQLQNLKTCKWEVSNIPHSLTICAPKLTKFRLTCVNPKHVILRTPKLHCLELMVKKHIDFIEVETFLCLRSLRLKAPVVGKLIEVFKGRANGILDVEVSVTLDALTSTESTGSEDLIRSFPAANSLKLGPGVLSNLERSFLGGCLSFESLHGSLRTLILHLKEMEFEFSVVSFMVSACPLLSEVVFIFPSNTLTDVQNNFSSSFAIKHPNIKWSRQSFSDTHNVQR